MSRRALLPLGLVLVASALVAAGCSSAPVEELSIDITNSPAPMDELIAEQNRKYPPMAFGDDPGFVEGTTLEFIPDFRASEGWREMTLKEQLAGGPMYSNGSYELDDHSCTISWSVAEGTQGDDKALSDELLTTLTGEGYELGERNLLTEHPDGSNAGTLEVVGALAPDDLGYVWARNLGGLEISVVSACDTADGAANAYHVVYESLPLVMTRPDEVVE